MDHLYDLFAICERYIVYARYMYIKWQILGGW